MTVIERIASWKKKKNEQAATGWRLLSQAILMAPSMTMESRRRLTAGTRGRSARTRSQTAEALRTS